MEALDDGRLFRVLTELECSQLLYSLGGVFPEDVSREFVRVVQQPYVHLPRVVDVRGWVVRHVAGWDETLDFAPLHLVVHVAELHNRGGLPKKK